MTTMWVAQKYGIFACFLRCFWSTLPDMKLNLLDLFGARFVSRCLGCPLVVCAHFGHTLFGPSKFPIFCRMAMAQSNLPRAQPKPFWGWTNLVGKLKKDIPWRRNGQDWENEVDNIKLMSFFSRIPLTCKMRRQGSVYGTTSEFHFSSICLN